MLIYFFGDVAHVGKFKKFNKNDNDYYGDFIITFKNNLNTHFIYTGKKKYLLNNIRILFEDCLIDLPNGGEEVIMFNTKKNNIYKKSAIKKKLTQSLK